MIERLPSLSKGLRSLILQIEITLSELGKLRVSTQPEALFRRKLIDLLETSEASLIDANALLLDAAMCSDNFDLALLMSQVETEAVP